VHAQLFKPFACPPLESDFQFFATADIDWYGGGPEHKTGWFATYDRVYMNVQRPESTFEGYSSVIGDFTWGNRIDLGFIDDDSKGWIATIWHVDGPNRKDVVVTERLNREATGSPREERVFPVRDNNNRLTGARDYLVTNSVNMGDLSGFELNRTWLWKPLHHGGRLQPLIGFRYAKFMDFTHRQSYARFDENGFLLDPNQAPANADIYPGESERLQSLQGMVLNDMVGGQLGMHWDKDYRRWNLSGDVKFLALQNFQSWEQTSRTETTIGPDDPPTSVVMVEQGDAFHTTEFVFGIEVRIDAAYRITRDLSLRGGFEFMDFGKGVGRGIDYQNNTAQDLIMFGATMGIAWNR